jgi:hypothetical protein
MQLGRRGHANVVNTFPNSHVYFLATTQQAFRTITARTAQTQAIRVIMFAARTAQTQAIRVIM